MAAIEVRDLTLAYGELTVLDRLNLDIAEGEFIVLLGPSGCGKSTLLNCIAGLNDITAGQIWIGGENVTWEEPSKRGIGMVFQSYALYPQMSVRGNLAFGLKNARVPKDEIERRIARAAGILQIEPLLDRRPAALSGGQRQRVAIGRALVRDVEVFLFDEPLSNLDAKLRSELRVEIKRLHDKLRNTMVYVTHDQIEALTLADRIAVLRGGVIQQLADPRTLYNKPANLFVAGFIGSPAMSMLRGTLTGEGTVHLGTREVSLAGYDGALPREAGREVILGVRPEHVTVLPDPGEGAGAAATGPGGALPARIDIDEPMGSDSLLWLTLEDGSPDGQTLSVRTAPDHGLGEGERVGLHFEIGKASIFDVATEERL